MRFLWLTFLLLGVAKAEDELVLAEPCDPEECKLPDCRCSGTDIPGGLAARDTPQFVMVTFDDGVNVLNIETYRSILYNRHNPDGCPAGATFYVNHEYTNYQLVNELYNQGFEIALHSISHRTPQTYWAEATVEDMRLEFSDQKIQMAHFASIPESEIHGIRIPFLQMAGNASFIAMTESGLTFDSSWTTVTFLDPGLWPYSLDYASTQECFIPPCPTASIPNVWVNPLVSWLDLQGTPCAMVDTCFFVPPLDDEEEWFKFIVTNFERQYLGNRSPFGFFAHEWYVSAYPAVGRALNRFLDMINTLPDVFMVNANQVIEWVKDPIPVNEYKTKGCRTFQETTCVPTNCGPLFAEHNQISYWMTICAACPNNYPWIGNPLGL